MMYGVGLRPEIWKEFVTRSEFVQNQTKKYILKELINFPQTLKF